VWASDEQSKRRGVLKGWAHSIKQPTSSNSVEKDSSGRTAGMSFED
jgi:hypothetical protein